MESLYDLKTSSATLGLGVEQIRKLILDGEVEAIQPGGPRGKLFIPQREIERLRAPVRPRAK